VFDRPQNRVEAGAEAESTRGGGGWWAVEPELGRVANGVAHRVDRLSAIGDGQVPAVVALAWRHLVNFPRKGQS
jgi:DNA (cytosine-5)-methyltransferase 1